MDGVKTIEDFEIGDEASFAKTISESDVYLFAGVTGDMASHHINKEFAKKSRFGQRVVQGMLTASLTTSPLSKLVAPGGLTVSHSFEFKAPVFIGDTIEATARVAERKVEKKILEVELVCVNQEGKTVLEGTATELMAIEKGNSE
jgi:3-hydroxybutyryl-CoA dehydratase